MAARVVDFVDVVFVTLAWRRCGSMKGRAGTMGAKGSAEALIRVADFAGDMARSFLLYER
jgi:hypothetical protein